MPLGKAAVVIRLSALHLRALHGGWLNQSIPPGVGFSGERFLAPDTDLSSDSMSLLSSVRRPCVVRQQPINALPSRPHSRISVHGSARPSRQYFAPDPDVGQRRPSVESSSFVAAVPVFAVAWFVYGFTEDTLVVRLACWCLGVLFFLLVTGSGS